MLVISETFVNATEHCMQGDTEWYEPYTGDVGKLYRSLQREYGRCISKVYQDTANGAIPCGWVFQSRDEYEDCPTTYLREVWVSVGDQDENGGVWLYDVVRRKTTKPV